MTSPRIIILLLPLLHAFTPLLPLRTPTLLHSTLPPGLTKLTKQPGTGPFLRIGDIATVKYSCNVSDNPPFAKGSAQKVVVGDGIMIEGWELALQTMRGGERSLVSVDPRLAYGSSGVEPFVPANAVVELDLEVIKVEAGIDLGTVASADPLKPRTPTSIAEAYNTRRQLAAMNEVEKKEGLDWLIAKISSSYFFGFFEGETGQKAPWYLRPSITFPLAFAIVGITFYAQFALGGIQERGAQKTDELDQIILTTILAIIN